MSNKTPSFKRTDGKYIHGREEVEALTNAVHSNKNLIEFNGKSIKLKEHIRDKNSWVVICVVV